MVPGGLLHARSLDTFHMEPFHDLTWGSENDGASPKSWFSLVTELIAGELREQ